MRKLFLAVLFLLYPLLSYSQDIVLDEIVVSGNSKPLPTLQKDIVERKDIFYRQYSSSDIVIEYHNVTLNDSADNKVELSHYPKYLLRSIDLLDRVSFGPTFSFYTPPIDKSLLLTVQVSSIEEYEIYTQFNTPYIQGFVFSSYSSGEFAFENSKGEIQQRENNSQNKLGASVFGVYNVGNTQIDPFFFYSEFQRGVGGLSEFPLRYKDAKELGKLLLSNVSTLTVVNSSILEGFLSYRHQEYGYENPHSRLSKDSKVDTTDNSIELKFNYSYTIKDWSLGGSIKYQYNSYNKETRNLFTFSPKVSYTTTCISTELEVPILIWSEIYPQYSLLFQYSIGDFTVGLSHKRTVRLPTFHELYFRNELVHGDKNLQSQISYTFPIFLKYSNDFIISSLSVEYSYMDNLIRFTQDTPYLFVAHNIPTVHVLSVTPNIEFDYSIFHLSFSYTYSYSKVKNLYQLPLLSEHELSLNTGINFQNYSLSIFYKYSSPKYLHFTNTTETLFDSDLGIRLSYKDTVIEAELEFDNILNSRRETSIQNPLPRFNTSFILKVLL